MSRGEVPAWAERLNHPAYPELVPMVQESESYDGLGGAVTSVGTTKGKRAPGPFEYVKFWKAHYKDGYSMWKGLVRRAAYAAHDPSTDSIGTSTGLGASLAQAVHALESIILSKRLRASSHTPNAAAKTQKLAPGYYKLAHNGWTFEIALVEGAGGGYGSAPHWYFESVAPDGRRNGADDVYLTKREAVEAAIYCAERAVKSEGRWVLAGP